MSNYTQVTFFAPKDALITGNPSKLIKGADVDPEFAAISAALATKLDKSGDTLFAADGSTGAPSVTFAADTDTGLARNSTNFFNLVAGGVIIAAVTPSGFFPLLADGVSNATPSITFLNDPDTGFGRDTANQVAVSLGGVKVGAFANGHASAKYAPVLTGSVTIDFGSIAAGTRIAATKIITGAAVTDALAFNSDIFNSGLIPHAQISSPDTISYGVTNASSVAIDPPSCTFTFAVIKL